ncbi:MAG: hypothetical protein KBG15_15250 [Kofleriaceae bacterium]|nr:hypothetical protein [Kofleriaceae bacterium]
MTTPSLRSTVRDVEWQQRVQLAVCTIPVRAQAGGNELTAIDGKILAGAQMIAKQVLKMAGAGMAWPALLRKLDRVNPGYQE